MPEYVVQIIKTCRLFYAIPQVREKAASLLVGIYRVVGERVRQDVEKKGLITDPTKRKSVLQRFDDARRNGEVSSPTSGKGTH